MHTDSSAKVDYLKPLEDAPHTDVQHQQQAYATGLKERLVEIVGPDHCSDDPADLQRYRCDASLEEGGTPQYVVRPATTEQVCRLLVCANETKLPVVPLSSGSHRYGATLPLMGGIMLDLSGWRDILRIDPRNRAVRIQPGVTYEQLQDALQPHGLRALTPLLPRTDQSVLTAHLEAQPMLIPEFNYSEPIYTMEIVMPKGELFRTGTAAVAPAETNQSDMIGPWGPGFDWNRLFTRSQGTLGVVTWANIMAEPRPRKQKLYFTAHQNIDRLIDFTYRLQRKWLGYECFILNRSALASILAETPNAVEHLQRQLPPFVQLFCIGGLKRFPDERIAYQEQDFLRVSQECGLHPQTTVQGAAHAGRFFEQYLQRCWPDDVHWKDRRRGGSADVFFITTMNCAPRFIAAMQQLATETGLNVADMGIYLQPVENGRAAHLEFTLPFNPDNTVERSRMQDLHRRASRRMANLGAVFTRAYGHWGQLTAGTNAVQYGTARIIKETLDPNNIMNPGKLGI